MQKNDVFLLRGNYKLGEILQNKGFNVFYTKNEPANIYPGDVILNCLLLNNKLYCSSSVDESIIDYANRRGIEICFVKQGYTACSCCVVDENSVITADNGLAAVLSGNGIDVLRIQPGYIELAGYDTGFIGGCSFKLSENKMLFTGKLSCHPSGNEIKSFLNKKGVKAIECDNENLVDIGSAAPILTD